MSNTAINRQQEGLAIANIDGAIKRINETKYLVKSQNGSGDYDICSTDLGWVCSCPDHKFRGVKCKHIFGVEISFALRKEVEVARIAPLTTTTTCIYCDSSNIVKDGLRHNKYGDIQKYDCRNCNRYFTINFGFEKMKSSPQTITSALQLYFTGESLRNVQKFLKLQGLKINHNTIYKWIKKYVTLMARYLELGYLGATSFDDGWRGLDVWFNVSYPRDMASGGRPVWQHYPIEDDYEDDDGQIVETEASIEHGASGSPFFDWFDDGQVRVIGVVSSCGTINGDRDSILAGGDNMVNAIEWARANWPL